MTKLTWPQNFRLELFKLKYHHPDVFVRCQWQKDERVPLIFLLYRYIIALLFLGVLMFGFLSTFFEKEGIQAARFPIFLTNWGYTICTVQFLLAVVLVTQRYKVQNAEGFAVKEEDSMPLSYKVYWGLHSTAIVIAIAITLCFWLLVYDPVLQPLNFLSVMTHAFNTIFMLVDFCIVAHPFRLLHFYWPTLVGILYALFSLIYFFAGGTNKFGDPYIYPPLNWNFPIKAFIVCIGTVTAVEIIHVLMWLLYKCRRWLFMKLRRNDLVTSNNVSVITSIDQIQFSCDSFGENCNGKYSQKFFDHNRVV